MPRKPTILMPHEQEFQCPRCQSTDKCLNGGDRYLCKNCGRNFIMKKAKPGRRGEPLVNRINILLDYLDKERLKPKYIKIKSNHAKTEFIVVGYYRPNVRKIAERWKISPTTFYKILKELQINLDKLNIGKVPSSMKPIINKLPICEKITPDIIRNSLGRKEIEKLLWFLGQPK